MQFGQNLIWKPVSLRPRFSGTPRGSVCWVWGWRADAGMGTWLTASGLPRLRSGVSRELSVRRGRSILCVLLRGCGSPSS